MEINKIEKYRKNISTAVFALVLYALFYTWFGYLLTDKLMLFPEISKYVNTVVFLAFILVGSFFNWEKVASKKTFLVLLGLLIILSSLSYAKYCETEDNTNYLPKIYEISSSFGFQGNAVVINGTNFGRAHQEGKVFLGDFEMIIDNWSEKEIEAIQQVSGEFGEVELFLVREDGVISNGVSYEIGDPSNF